VPKSRSVNEILEKLEEQVAFHAERESFHAAQEAIHGEQRSSHATALEEARSRLEAFRAATAGAIELADRDAPPRPTGLPNLDEEDLGSASKPKVGRMVSLLVEAKEADERFGPVGLCAEVNERFKDRLRRAVSVAQVSIVLRRLHQRGLIQLARPGRPYLEALYARAEHLGDGDLPQC
jgi:hypothetical protein